MVCWSAENATKAYIRAMKMGKGAKEPDVAEFISALAAGTNAQLMVIACASAADSATLALVAAAHQTGGRIVCILRGDDEVKLSKEALGNNANHVKLVTGDAQTLLMGDYKEADFIVIDCNLEHSEGIIETAQKGGRNSIVLGYNALSMGSWRCQGLNAHFLPIGEGLLVTRIAASAKNGASATDPRKKSRWVVRVDKCTGEEHVFRIRSPHGKVVEA